MHLERVIAALAPADVLRRAPVEIGDLAYDARAAGPGSLFFCVPGTRADGHDFAADAVANGAVALVVERRSEERRVGKEGRSRWAACHEEHNPESNGGRGYRPRVVP